MKTLQMSEVDALEAHLLAQARPLDWALWQVWRGRMGWEQGLTHLLPYQNADGGFGRGIEPDVWHPASSPLATTVALQYAHALGVPRTHAVWHRAHAYLMGSYDAVAGKWHPMTTGVNAFPHAPWWHADADTGQNALDGDWPNPTVEIIGALSAGVPTWEPLTGLYAALVAYVDQAETMEAHALACYVRAYATVPDAVQRAIFPPLVRLVRSTVHADPAAWATAYVPTPLDYVQAPTSPFFADMHDVVAMQLDQWVTHVQTQGLWYPTWQWGRDADAWQLARQWWAGKMTVERLIILERYGRVR